MEKVRAKFRVHVLDKQQWGTKLAMSPVYSTDPNSENKAFWDATPSGEITMWIKNEAAVKYFEVNKEYYIDFVKAE